jgi:hypothetical protein
MVLNIKIFQSSQSIIIKYFISLSAVETLFMKRIIGMGVELSELFRSNQFMCV